MTKKLYDFSLKNIDGQETSLGDYAGKVLMLVNVASQCGLTPQYEALEKLYEKYNSQGLEILAFPANEFGAQEPGTDAEIKSFCQTNYNVKFPVFSKIVVKGEAQHPLYKFLTETKPQAKVKPDSKFKDMLNQHGLLSGGPSDIMWNFEKFLINREGEVIERFSPDIVPDDPMIISKIESELKK